VLRGFGATVTLGVLPLLLVAACGSDNTSSTASAPTTVVAGSSTTSGSASGSTSATTSTSGGSAGSAASAAWDGVLSAAAAEGKLTVYSVLVPDINTRLTDAFKKAYPKIAIEIIRVAGNEIDAKLDAEQQSGSAGGDAVINVNYPYAVKALADGKLAAFTGPDAIGPNWKGTPYLDSDRIQYSTFTNIGLGWNTGAYPSGGPKTYDELLDPKYGSGKIGLPDPIAPVVADFYATLQDNFGQDVLQKLAAQKPAFFPGAVPLEQSLASGEISVGGYVTNVGLTAAKAKSAPVEFAKPPKAWLPPILSYIPTWVKHPNAAQVLVNFMATPAGQEVLGKDGYSALPNIPGTVGPIEQASIANVKRITQPGWYDSYYADWKKTFGR
jgi:iron(III) transport system substrate-binding protein